MPPLLMYKYLLGTSTSLIKTFSRQQSQHCLSGPTTPLLQSPLGVTGLSRQRVNKVNVVVDLTANINNSLFRLQQLIITRQNSSRAQKRRTLDVKVTTLDQNKFKMEYPKITLFGDSITHRSTDVDNGCWGSMIEFRVSNFFDLDTRGFEGYNTKWALELMPKLFPKSYLDKVEIFIPFFGHNDSWAAQNPMHVPVDDYEINMRKLVKYLIDNGLEKRKIIMITPTWYYHEDFAAYLGTIGMPVIGKSYEDAEKYAEAVLRVASDEAIEVVDFFKISAKQEPLRDMFCDGVHFSRLGAKMLFDQLMPIIEKKIESSYKKPLADLWTAVPFDQHPEMKPMLDAYIQSLKKQ